MTAKASKSKAERGYTKTDLEDILGAAAESGTLLLLAQNRAQPRLASC